ncbi:PAAR domain-containing protein [Rhodanobacter sp. AS-Z3]|uniref:PAAR domain-containing protein n=1 Tax=Rhodanobacter sp. AS-Z3 TaxID=3031330 RepID=UPI00247B1827|nr:PAAR domain-containing protein [Rhodanobacter sp. AS-Z3]WEN13754.1 PAAR domain-containing protein [Rhodanobacter sp. AS-Z3]
MGFAARVTDMIVSTATSSMPVPIIPPGDLTVLIGGLPAARMSDGCGVDVVLLGSMTVMIGGLPAARIGDPTGAGGMVTAPGCLTVLIGG